MLLDTLYVFFEVCVMLVLVFAALWLATQVLGYVYMFFAGELFERGGEGDRRREADRREAERHRHLPTPG